MPGVTVRATLLSLIFVLVLSLSIGLMKTSQHAKSHPVARPSSEPPKELEVKAATPGDPGPTTVVSPLATWAKESQSTQAPAPAASSAPAPQVTFAADHVDATPLPAPRRFLHAQFTVADYRGFAFTVPPHAVDPTLRGKFRAFTKGSSGSASSKPADIDLMVMSDGEFDDFVHGRSAEATYEADSSPNLRVKYAMPHTLDRARLYHLVFRNSGGSRTTFVEADFTVSFE